MCLSSTAWFFSLFSLSPHLGLHHYPTDISILSSREHYTSSSAFFLHRQHSIYSRLAYDEPLRGSQVVPSPSPVFEPQFQEAYVCLAFSSRRLSVLVGYAAHRTVMGRHQNGGPLSAALLASNPLDITPFLPCGRLRCVQTFRFCCILRRFYLH